MGKFLKFEKMITPFIIQIIFWLGVLGSIFGGLGLIAIGIFSDANTLSQIAIGLFTMFVGPIVIRIYCEILMVMFTMQRALISIRDSVAVTNVTNNELQEEELI